MQNLKGLLIILLFFFVMPHGIPVVDAAQQKPQKTLTSTPLYTVEKDWQGSPYKHTFSFGLLGGTGLFDGSVGFSMLGAVAFNILSKGFIPDINEQVFIEVEAGPLFLSGATGFTYSGHLRWDFHMNYLWSFYALAGFGGSIVGALTRFHPRMGAGVLWNVFEKLSLRGEFSHEFVGAGVAYPL